MHKRMNKSSYGWVYEEKHIKNKNEEEEESEEKVEDIFSQPEIEKQESEEEESEEEEEKKSGNSYFSEDDKESAVFPYQEQLEKIPRFMEDELETERRLKETKEKKQVKKPVYIDFPLSLLTKDDYKMFVHIR